MRTRAAGAEELLHDDIAWQHRYVDIMTVTADGRLFIDYARFHDVTPDGVNAADGGDGAIRRFA